MNHNTAQGFLDDILAHPEDDTPRLIFADWLEDHGDPARAEFIRLQIKLAPLPSWDGERVRLRLREAELLALHGKAWREALPTIKGVTWGDFGRGFVAGATFANFGLFEKKGAAIWAAAPIERVTVRWPRQDDATENLAGVAALRELTVTGTVVDPRDVVRLANAPLLSTLRTLTLREVSLAAEGFQRIITSPYLGNLSALRVPYNSIGNAGIAGLPRAQLPALTELDLSEEGSYGRYGEDPIVDVEGIEGLVAWAGMPRLRSLKLAGNDVGAAGLLEIVESPRCSGLKELVLRGNAFDSSVPRQFAAAHPDLMLDVLDVGENLLWDSGAQSLADAACLRELKVLEIDRCELSARALDDLARAPFLATLRRLNVSENQVEGEGLSAFIDRKPPHLHTLVATDCDLENDAAERIATAPGSDVLLELDLRLNGMQDAAAEVLGASNYLRSLLVLRLKNNDLSKEAAQALAASPLGRRLKVLECR